MNPIETQRLTLRELTAADAAFILELVNDPDWRRWIGDKGVRTLGDAQRYIADGPAAMYGRFGFGLWRVGLAGAGDVPIGICGLIKRDALEDVDLGFAFLPAYRARGYAHEAAAAAVERARDVHGLRRLVAITAPGNVASTRLLSKLGFRYETAIRLPGEVEDVALYARDL